MAFTLVELMMAVGIASIVIAMTTTFIVMAAKGISGIAKQSKINDEASYTSEFVFKRIRYATSTMIDGSGNTLTLGFDDNCEVDSNNDKKTYNDQDHYEILQFVNGDGNDATTADNQLIYTNGLTHERLVLISSYISKFPNQPVFSIRTNSAAVYVRYGLTDDNANDGHQHVDIQSRFVPRNRMDASSTIMIVP